MKNKLFLSLGVLVSLMVLLAGCNFPSPTEDLSSTMAINVAVAQTAAVIQTQAAQTISAFEALHPSETPTPTVTNTPIYTATPDKVTITMTKDTYCRKGTNSAFPSIMYVTAGQTLEVIARNPTHEYYYVADPNHTMTYCWLWGEYATVSGDDDILPIYTSIPLPTNTPSPTPAPDFSIEYTGLSSCGSNYYLRFYLRNPTTKYTWQYVQMSLTDTTSSISASTSSTNFTDYSGCSVTSSQSDLAPGEDGGVASYGSPFTYDPTGHSVTTTITVCQNDSASGCINKSITVTP